jgi:hypothetical protein
VFIVLFAADPSIPHAVVFKKTSVKCGQVLLSLEKMRGSRGPGLYAMSFKKESNDEGSWIVPVIQPKGDPSDELRDTALTMASTFSVANITVKEDDDPLGGMDSDNTGVV